MPRPQSKRKRSVFSRKKLRQMKGSGTGNKKQGGGYYTVECSRHGRRSVGETVSWVRVSPPKNKRQATSGCPYCRRENQ